MKTLLLSLSLVLLSGCVRMDRASKPFWRVTPAEQACISEKYCGPDAGEIIYGSTICYTNHLSEDYQYQDSAKKWHWHTPGDLKCR